MFRALSSALLSLMLAAPVLAQSQAANGAIEGTVTDSQSGVLPGVTVTVTNVDTGLARTVVTNEKGLYRAPLLPLGTYRVVAELQGFKTFNQTGIILSVGESAVVNIRMAVGSISETITVTADSPLVDTSRIDIGHNLSELEVKNLPLVARNPYNLALVQPGVTGFENVEFGVPRLAANGASMRINYQIDGNTNTEKDRAGLRLLPISETAIQEVKVVTTGFAPEFGQTMGMVYNAITPSGTNKFKGEGSYLFRRKDFSAFPFFFQQPYTDANKPETRVDTGTATLGGPIVPNKLFFYGGWEQTRRDLSSTSLITITQANAAAVGLKAQPTAAPNVQTGKFFIGKSDYQINNANRLTARWLQFHNDAPYNSGGGLSSLERATDFLDAMDSVAGQLVSSIGSHILNEARVQYAHRHQSSVANSDSGTGPAITVTNIANFGGPWAGTGQGNAGFDFKQNITQVIDNLTYIRSSHSYKFGIDYQWVHDERVNAPQFAYTFPTAAAYVAAKAGTAPRGYTTMSQITGELSFAMDTQLASFFVQDDWQVASNVKVLYGIRYDLYRYPNGRADAPLASSQSFNIDRNNWGPRVGVAWSVNPNTVLRGSMGIMYDQPLLGTYEQALQQSGSPRSPVYSYSGTTPGAPAFPNGISTGTLPVQSPFTVDPAFETARTWQNNVQLERALGKDFSASVSLMYARSNGLPVNTNINVINPIGTLADGRGIYSTTVSAATRMDPRFNSISMVQSIGEGDFKSVTIQTTKRFSQGVTFNVQYSLGKGTDNAPINSSLSVVGEGARSDPKNLARDEGPNPLDMRHNFSGNVVYTSTSHAQNPIVRALLAGNEIGALIQMNSGLPVNITGNRDLNGDGTGNDRPLNVGRNALYLPNRYNMDMRYTRWIPLRGSVRAEIIAELKNAFNNDQTSGINASVPVDTLGNPTRAIPTDASEFNLANGFNAPSGYEQRKFQLGFKFRF